MTGKRNLHTLGRILQAEIAGIMVLLGYAAYCGESAVVCILVLALLLLGSEYALVRYFLKN